MTPIPSHTSETITVIGGGLAGTEAALQLAAHGYQVLLFEMRPHTPSPAHHTDRLAELVCSNSLKSQDESTAAGQLKRELTALGCRVLATAHATSVPAGGALAVDRDEFSSRLTALVESEPLIELIRTEVTRIPEGRVIIATGPLTSPGLEGALSDIIGPERLAFFDAAAPIVDAETIDRSVVFPASRYGKGEGDDYLNCPLNRQEYERLVAALVDAHRVHAKDFERRELFAACQPAEEIARSGPDALRYGPLKPVGLTDPRTGERPWAVVQLRAENRSNTAYNLVGFQTNLTFPEQERVFRMIPGLESAEFARHGVMHRNTFVDAPRLLDATLALRTLPRIRIAGQLAGTEGYMEAAASGLLAALATMVDIRGLEPLVLPATGAFGALIAYATDPATERYQPMHVNWGIVPPLETRVRGKRERYAAYAARAQADTLAALASHPLTAAGGAAV
ncbi:MAG: methylenetetrahydrofolate--tRNA-(uracil(54)-C(5))-methyltransferase (FADH(2)-oxidizing) TrmFO [Coriobacteriia bacterium]